MKPSALFVGIAAGAASGLLFAGLVFQSSAALWLAFAAPVPVAIASLGWGTAAGFIAAVVGAGLIFAATGIEVQALTLLLGLTLPMAVAGHLAGLSRPAGEAGAAPQPSPLAAAKPQGPLLDWYPLERVFHALVLFSVVACIVVGWRAGFDPAGIAGELEAAFRESGAAAQGFDDAQLAQATALLVGLVPFVQPAMLVLILVLGLYLGAAATRVSGRLPRPRDDLPRTARLPRVALGVFAAGLLGSLLLSGSARLAADVVAGGYGCALTLVGLAGFHARTRGRAGRILILVASYGVIVFLAFPLFAFTILGIVETSRNRRPRSAGA